MKKANTIVFFATPGGGKDTHSRLLIKYLEEVLKEPVLYIGTGDEFRKLDQSNHTNNIVKKTIVGGGLAPDFLVESIVGNSMIQNMTQDCHLILNGFPRTLAQAEKLFEMAKFYNHKVKVVFLKISPEEATKRIVGRKSGRLDGSVDSIRKRFEVFERENVSLENYFKSNFELICIDGDDEKEKVHKKIVKSLKLNID